MEVVMKEGEDGACNKVQNSGLGWLVSSPENIV